MSALLWVARATSLTHTVSAVAPLLASAALLHGTRGF